MELTTVANDHAVAFDGPNVLTHDNLEPDQIYEWQGFGFKTLPAPGELLSTFATVNDVHFGETECGVIDGLDLGPIFTTQAGETPYPVIMNRGAIAEMKAIDPDAVVVKGDLTSRGTREEYQQFLDEYGPAFGTKLHHIRGNHDSYFGENFASEAPFHVDIAGVRIAVIDTSILYEAHGEVKAGTLEWLGDISAEADVPVLAFGHHHAWSPDSNEQPEGYFGINAQDSEDFAELVARQPAICGYFAGHTHRNRVRHFSLTGNVPWVEVACVKDFPGAWVEYRVYEGGILQIFHRIQQPDALEWTEKTKDMFGGMYHDYAFGALDDRCFAIWPR